MKLPRGRLRNQKPPKAGLLHQTGTVQANAVSLLWKQFSYDLDVKKLLSLPENHPLGLRLRLLPLLLNGAEFVKRPSPPPLRAAKWLLGGDQRLLAILLVLVDVLAGSAGCSPLRERAFARFATNGFTLRRFLERASNLEAGEILGPHEQYLRQALHVIREFTGEKKAGPPMGRPIADWQGVLGAALMLILQELQVQGLKVDASNVKQALRKWAAAQAKTPSLKEKVRKGAFRWDSKQPPPDKTRI